MKTREEWLAMLPPAARWSAIRQTPQWKLADPCLSFSAALMHAFPWCLSREGERYWVEKHETTLQVLSMDLSQLAAAPQSA